MRTHPAADLFPMQPDNVLEALAEDIRANGQRQAIVFHEGFILSGRARLYACEMAGVHPWFHSWPGGYKSVTLAVIEAQLQNRTIPLGIRAAIGAQCVPLVEAEGIELPADDICRIMDLSRASLTRAVNASKLNPEGFERLKRGEVTLNHVDPNRKDRRRLLGSVEAAGAAEVLSRAERIVRIRTMASEGHLPEQVAADLGLTVEHTKRLANANGIAFSVGGFGRMLRLDPNRIVRETVMGAHNLVAGLDSMGPIFERVDIDSLPEWLDSLSQSLNVLNRLARQLRRRLENGTRHQVQREGTAPEPAKPQVAEDTAVRHENSSRWPAEDPAGTRR